jgi:hypothetical protein
MTKNKTKQREGAKMYNGHKNWNHWNVNLWINNDEALYQSALYCLKVAGGSRKRAAKVFYDALTSANIGTLKGKTPDGAPYSISAIYHAMEGLKA